MRVAVLAILGATCLLAGCRTAPEFRYYTLNMTPSGRAVPDFSIEIDRLRASQSLARRDILIKKTPLEVEYYAEDQWAADPGELVGEKLSSEFGHRPDAAKRILLGGQVLAFEQVDGPAAPKAHIKLNVELRLADGDRLGTPALKKTYEVELPVGGAGPSSLAEALSNGLEKIAADIVVDAGKL